MSARQDPFLPPLSQLALAFNTATLFFALPLFERIAGNPGLPAVLRLMLLVQVLPTAATLLLDHLVARDIAPTHQHHLAPSSV